MILAREFSLLWRIFANFGGPAEEEYPLISRIIAKKSTASFPHLQKGVVKAEKEEDTFFQVKTWRKDPPP